MEVAADDGRRVEDRVVGQERSQQGHGRDHDEDREAGPALPVAAEELPDLPRVPHRQAGTIGVGAAPRPHARAAGNHGEQLEEPVPARMAASQREAGRIAGPEHPGQEDHARGHEHPSEDNPRLAAHEADDPVGQEDDAGRRHDPGRIASHGRRGKAGEHVPHARGERAVLGVGAQTQDEPGERRPNEYPGLQPRGDHACTRGSR